MKKILLLTDFSENSINAIHYALRLFKNDVCQFYILHVETTMSYVSDDLVMSGNQSVHDSILKKSKQKLSELLNDLKVEYKNDNFSYHMFVDYDRLTDAINQLKLKKSFDLIVMGSNGVTGAKEAVFGSNTINVIRNIDCVTLIIPEGFTYQKPSEILLPLDLNDSLDSKAFLTLLNFASRFSQKMHLLRVNPNDETSLKQDNDKAQIDKLIKHLDCDYHIINNVPMEHAISSYLQTHSINLTALIVQKENFLERIFMGSSTTKISNMIPVPLLVFHS